MNIVKKMLLVFKKYWPKPRKESWLVYLEQSTDIYDLEHRERELANRKINNSFYYRQS